MEACAGSAVGDGFAMWDSANGWYKSECLAGDDEALAHCLQCERGYTDVGLTCNKGVAPWEWKVYGRKFYDYVLPSTDVGLTRRRRADAEWRLP